jgi:HlyD family secretion protein
MTDNDNELDIMAESGKGRSRLGKVILIVLIAAVAVGAYFIYKSFTKAEISYLTMPVSQGNIVDQVQATGSIKPLHEVDLYFRQQGTLTALYARSGDPVTAGQVLAVQDDDRLQAEVEQQRSSLLQAQYKLKQAQYTYEKMAATFARQDALYQQGALARADWEQAKRDLDNEAINVQSAQTSIKTSQAQLVIAENNLENARLVAPFSGVAAQVNGEVGQETGNTSTSMFHLISNELQLTAMVNEVDIGRVQVGQEVEYTVTSYPGQKFKGAVTRISPQSSAANNVQLYEVDISTRDMSHKLRAGMSVTANIIVNKRANVVMVPNLALTYAQTFQKSSLPNRTGAGGQKVTSGAGRMQGAGIQAPGQAGDAVKNVNKPVSDSGEQTQQVVMLQDGKPVVKRVKVGLSDGTNTEVKEGLKAGDQVVVGANDPSKTNSTGGSQQPGGQSGNRSVPGMGGAVRINR